MEPFDLTQLRRLLDVTSEACVSVYLPTHPSGGTGQQDAIRFKNLCGPRKTDWSHWEREAPRCATL